MRAASASRLDDCAGFFTARGHSPAKFARQAYAACLPSGSGRRGRLVFALPDEGVQRSQLSDKRLRATAECEIAFSAGGPDQLIFESGELGHGVR